MLGVKAMKELGLTGLPVTHIENASATGLVAFREAAWAVASGRAEVAMAIGFDKMTDMTGRGRRRQPAGAPGATSSTPRSCRPRTSPCGRSAACTTTARRPRHFAAIAAKNWNHGALNPLAHRQPDHTVTVDEVLGVPHDPEPLTAMMACPADDGAACVIVASEEWVRRHQPDRRVVRPMSSARAERGVLARPHLPRPGRRARRR